MSSGHEPAAGPVAALPPAPWPAGSATAASRRGPAHSHNEDRWGLVGTDDLLLLAVADGMGGTAGGGTAAGIALQALLELADTHPGQPTPGAAADPPPAGPERGGDPVRAALLDAMTRAHDRVRAAAPPGLPDALRPGSTLTAAVVLGDRLVIGHVGDSACWLLRRGVLERLTEVHTHAAVLVAAGAVDRGSPAARRLDSLLTRHLGMPGELRPQLAAVPLQAGDRVLLATDGLTRALPPAALAALTARSEATAARLVNAAVAAGAKDDVTVLLATVGEVASGYAASVGVAAGELTAEAARSDLDGGAGPAGQDDRPDGSRAGEPGAQAAVRR